MQRVVEALTTRTDRETIRVDTAVVVQHRSENTSSLDEQRIVRHVEASAIGIALGGVHGDGFFPGVYKREFGGRAVGPLIDGMRAVDWRDVRLVVRVVINVKHRWITIPCYSISIPSEVSRFGWTALLLGVGLEVEESNYYRRLVIVESVTTLRNEDGAECRESSTSNTSRGNRARVFDNSYSDSCC